MKRIFNSLGSNYDFDFVYKSLFGSGGADSNSRLISLLNKKYEGDTVLLYKGREAIKLSLDLLGLPAGSKVGVNGFTCYVVYKAIIDSGCIPVYLDIEEKSLNFSSRELESRGKGLKALIVQNTLGNPCDIFAIKKYCYSNGIVLIEDLAHSVGSLYGNREVGTVGDFAALSFSQDKMIDSVSGGALVIRNKKYKKNLPENFKRLNMATQLRDRFYPFWTFLIRHLYQIGLGNLLHFVLKKLKLLSQPIADSVNIFPQYLPGWYADLAFERFRNIEINLDHRKSIARIYSTNINKKAIPSDFVTNLDTSSNIRFPIFVKNRKDLIGFLKKKGIYVSDVWYDAPVAPVRYLKFTNYQKGKCPVSEKISGEIINLPTHINISDKDAIFIATKINEWLSTQ